MPDKTTQTGENFSAGTQKSSSLQAWQARASSEETGVGVQPEESKLHIPTLATPQTPSEAILSRRTPCYGFAASIRFNDEALEFGDRITQAMDEIKQRLLSQYFGRAPVDHRVKHPNYIAQKTYHGTFFGMKPCLDESDFELGFLNNILSKDNLAVMEETLREHLDHAKPYLQFQQFELRPDGSVLARFEYKNAQGEYCLPQLKKSLDPTSFLDAWDSAGARANVSVAAVICAINLQESNHRAEVEILLKEASEKLSLALGETKHLSIRQVEISHYRKRTMTPKKVQVDAKISNEGNKALTLT